MSEGNKKYKGRKLEKKIYVIFTFEWVETLIIYRAIKS